MIFLGQCGGFHTALLRGESLWESCYIKAQCPPEKKNVFYSGTCIHCKKVFIFEKKRLILKGKRFILEDNVFISEENVFISEENVFINALIFEENVKENVFIF